MDINRINDSSSLSEDNVDELMQRLAALQNPLIRHVIDQSIRNTNAVHVLQERYHKLLIEAEKIPTLVATVNELMAKVRELELDSVTERGHRSGLKAAFDTIHKWTGWLAAGGVALLALIIERTMN